MSDQLRPSDFHDSEGVEDWRVIGDGATAYFATGSFATGARFVQAIAELPGLGEQHPDVDLRFGGVTVRLVTLTDDRFGLTDTDVDLARRISAIAGDLGLTSDPSRVQSIGVCIDALVTDRVLPFWRAVLGYDLRAGDQEDLIDPQRRGPLTYYQQMEQTRTDRNRIHFDVWVAHDRAEARVEAALAAGGRLVTDEHAPSWWVLADAEGNEVCVCTWQDAAGGV